MVQDGLGNFWGTHGIGSLGGGSIFKVNAASGQLTVVSEFEDLGSIGENLGLGELVNDGAGNLWATTQRGGVPLFPGTPGKGSILKVDTATGAVSTVVDFKDFGQGLPSTRLVADGNGRLWGRLAAALKTVPAAQCLRLRQARQSLKSSPPSKILPTRRAGSFPAQY
jgi:hypothetical protein